MSSLKPKTYNLRPSSGFTLIEILIALALFILISASIYLVSNNILGVVSRNQLRATAVSVIESEIETVRNMQFQDVGIIGGFPVGLLEAEKNITVRGINLKLNTTVRTIDDPFDGTIGGNPNDTAPADYKLVEFEVVCLNCSTPINPITMTTTAAPKNLETTTNNGALFINVFDASGAPIQNVDVHIENNALNPTIEIDDETNTEGILQIIDIPTSTQSYEISVSKSGYSSAQTYPLGDPDNPNPIKQHATVVSQAITSVSFAIDRVSTLYFDATDAMCLGILNINFTLQGSKLIGTAPDVYKYSVAHSTDSLGHRAISGLEWDLYTATNDDGAYDLAGSAPVNSVTLNPDSTANMRWLVAPTNPSALRVVVEDESGAPIDDASVRLQGGSTDATFLTGRKAFDETDWSAGQYSAKDTGIDADSVPGQITLTLSGGIYATGTVSALTSNTFDLGTSTTQFHTISWNPTSQPPQTGSNSLRIQIATNNDNGTWAFLGPDGTGSTYYTTSGETIDTIHGGDRYLRYKVYMQTANATSTPSLEDVELEFSSSCIPDGQAFFNGLSTGIYTITVNKAGYQTYTDTAVSISSDWQSYNVTLIQ